MSILPKNFPENLNSIALTGYYGFGNLGDDLLLLSALNEYHKGYSLDIRIIANKHPYLEKMLKDFEFKSILIYNRWDINSIAQAIRYSDGLVFGGGGIFQDETSFKSFFYYFFSCFLSKFNKRHLIIDRNSIGPINSKLSKYLFNYIINWAYSISVRDSISYEYLINNYPNFVNKFYKREDFVLSPFFDIKDKVYSNEKKQRLLFILRPSYIKKDNKIIEHPNIFNLKKLIVSLIKDYKDFEISIIVFMEQDLEKLSDIFNYLENNEDFNENFKEKQDLYNSILLNYKNFNLYYPGYGNIIATLKYIKESLIIISNRLHGVLLAKVFNIPVLAISNSIKIEGISRDYNIPYINLNAENLNNQIINFIKETLNKNTSYDNKT